MNYCAANQAATFHVDQESGDAVAGESTGAYGLRFDSG
jgi:hypothetical protein